MISESTTVAIFLTQMNSVFAMKDDETQFYGRGKKNLTSLIHQIYLKCPRCFVHFQMPSSTWSTTLLRTCWAGNPSWRASQGQKVSLLLFFLTSCLGSSTSSRTCKHFADIQRNTERVMLELTWAPCELLSDEVTKCLNLFIYLFILLYII